MSKTTTYYLEYANGNCSIIHKTDNPQSLKRRERATLVRPATAEDIAHFTRMGGCVR